MYLNVGKLISDVRRIAAQNPEFVYDVQDAYGNVACMYFEPYSGRPSCLIGKGLALQGITYGMIAPLGLNTCSIGTMLDKVEGYGTEIRYVDAVWLTNVQKRQDGNMPWSDCIRSADEAKKDFTDA